MSKETLDDFMPLSEGVIERFTGADRYLISFPRSGRSWLNRCLRIAQHAHREGVTPDESFIRSSLIGIHRLNRDLNASGMKWENPFSAAETPVGFLMSHAWHGVPTKIEGPHCFLFRTPEDSMVSYFNYASFHRFIDPQMTPLSDFVNGNLPYWISHTKRGLLAVSKHPDNWMCLSYESLYSNPVQKMSKISSRMGFEISDTVYRTVSETLTPRFVEEAFKRERPSLSARPGEGKTRLSLELLEKIRTEAGPTYRKALELENL